MGTPVPPIPVILISRTHYLTPTRSISGSKLVTPPSRARPSYRYIRNLILCFTEPARCCAPICVRGRFFLRSWLGDSPTRTSSGNAAQPCRLCTTTLAESSRSGGHAHPRKPFTITCKTEGAGRNSFRQAGHPAFPIKGEAADDDDSSIDYLSLLDAHWDICLDCPHEYGLFLGPCDCPTVSSPTECSSPSTLGLESPLAIISSCSSSTVHSPVDSLMHGPAGFDYSCDACGKMFKRNSDLKCVDHTHRSVHGHSSPPTKMLTSGPTF